MPQIIGDGPPLALVNHATPPERIFDNTLLFLMMILPFQLPENTGLCERDSCGDMGWRSKKPHALELMVDDFNLFLAGRKITHLPTNSPAGPNATIQAMIVKRIINRPQSVRTRKNRVRHSANRTAIGPHAVEAHSAIGFPAT
ncbi:MAG: hypothetical protein QGF67_19395, partial [Lentisphaeria bacterium]|nr:hypothetical protein [Lentisphaeria bacterium]